jgi:hypothetical protein
MLSQRWIPGYPQNELDGFYFRELGTRNLGTERKINGGVFQFSNRKFDQFLETKMK